MRRRISPVTVIASVALVFAVTGTGMAAGHYLITSTSQIKPSVLRSIRGKLGPQGPAGAQGAPGATGAAGTSFSTSDVSVATGTPETLCPVGGGSCEAAVGTATCPSGSVAIAGGFDGGASPPVVASIAEDEPLRRSGSAAIAIANNGRSPPRSHRTWSALPDRPRRVAQVRPQAARMATGLRLGR